MLPLAGRITEAMQLRFLHIKQYDLPHTWKIENRVLEQAVIWLIEDGGIALEAKGETLRCGAGELIFLTPGTRLTCRAMTASLRIISLNYETAVPLERGGRWPASMRFPLRYGNDATELAAVIRGMLADEAADSAGKELLQQGGLLRVLGLMTAGYAAVHGLDPSDSRSDNRVSEAIAYMTSRPDGLPTVRQLAEAVRASEPHLRKLFIRDTGMPPLQYLHRWKAKMAMRRLAASDERVSEIAYALGYEDANYFSRMFKKAVGFSPLEYRRKHRDWMQSPQE